MRILSQSGMIDLPYENVGVSMSHKNGTEIIAYPASNYNSEFGKWKMAEYSTADKAQKAMEILRNVYHESEKEKVYKDGASYLTTHFQFPQDSELEVKQ